ncbi:MAG: CPBP family intramembrane metalloprotease [Clostridia bacterium]|nr:CPBP family intramembrane metalloprotease [Clostridia bacterium]
MNGFYNDFNRVVIETPEERQRKVKEQRRLFSRVFLALLSYILISHIVTNATYTILSVALTREQYTAFATSGIWPVVISSVVQYILAFPIFLLILMGTRKSQRTEMTSLSLSDFTLLFFIGQTFMFAGNLIGNMINSFFGALIGKLPENGIATAINETPLWVIVIFMVILGPIVEELMFRKIIIDRLSVYGDRVAIIFSAVSFGLMHGNLYQFFYAAMLGALLGYVYAKTRKVKYTVYMHMIINFLGSVGTLIIQDYTFELQEMLAALQNGAPVNVLALLAYATIVFIYSNLQNGMIIAGVIALVHYIRKRKINISPDKDVYLPDGEIVKNGVSNTGAILFLIATLFLMILNLF